MQLIIILILLAIVIAVFRRFDAFIFFIAIVDIFLRIMAFFQTQVPDPEVASILARYFPASIPRLIGSYTSGIIYTVFIWLYVIVYIIFEYYIIRSFFRRR